MENSFLFLRLKSLFLGNKTIKQTVFKNAFWLGLAEAVTGFLKLVLLVCAARILGATEYGKFAFAFSFVSTLVIFADLGIINIVTREFSRDKTREDEFPGLVFLEIVLSAGALILMVVGSFFITRDLAIRKIIFFLGFFILITNFFGIFYAFLRSRQRMEYEAIIKIAQNFLIVGASLFALFYFHSVLGLSLAYLFSNIISLALLLVFFNYRFQPLKIKWDKKAFNLLKISWPLSLGIMGSWIYISIGSIILGYFNLITENGWYNAAAKVSLMTIIPANLIMISFYPALSNFFVSSKEKLQKSWEFLMGAMVFLAIPLVVLTLIFAEKIINIFYGPAFAPSVCILQFLMLAAGINFITYPYSAILVVSDKQKENFILMAVGISLNIILNLILIWNYKLYGVAAATVASSLSSFLLTMFVSRKFWPH
jgi:O-antigen/teichoic acid export membrane protein